MDQLSAFFWATKERPLVPGDVFANPPRTPRPIGAPISATGDDDKKDAAKDKKDNKQDKKTTINRTTSSIKRKQQ
jgi:hypothetical protein